MFFSWKVSKFLHAALFANAMKVDVCEFQVKNYAILRLRLWKPIVSISSQIPYYPKAIYGQKKIKGIDFSTLAMKWRFNCSIFPNRRSYSGYHLTRVLEWIFFPLFKPEFSWTSINCFHRFPCALTEKVPSSLQPRTQSLFMCFLGERIKIGG